MCYVCSRDKIEIFDDVTLAILYCWVALESRAMVYFDHYTAQWIELRMSETVLC